MKENDQPPVLNGHHAAVDLSGPQALLAVAAPDGEILLDTCRPMSSRESSLLAAWLQSELAAIGLEMAGIGRWTVGAGPGSFTGLRLAAALAAGLGFGRGGRSRCVPTAIALAAGVPVADGGRIGVIFDGRNSELLLFEVICRNGELRPGELAAVCDSESMRKIFSAGRFHHFCAALDARPAVLKLLAEAEAARIEFLPLHSAVPLLRAEYQEFDNDLTRLVYIRPAVFTSGGGG